MISLQKNHFGLAGFLWPSSVNSASRLLTSPSQKEDRIFQPKNHPNVVVSYINTFMSFWTFSTPSFFPRMIPSFIVGSWFCSTGVDAATLEWSPGDCPKKRIPGSTRNHTYSFQNAGFWMVPQPGSAVPSAVSEDEGLLEGTPGTPGSFPRDPAHHQTQLGFPTRLIHSSPDPTKVRVSDRNRASKQHQKNTWKGASQQIQAKERPLIPDKFPIQKGEFPHGYQCNVHGQFLRQSVTSRTSMDSISGPGFCTIKYPAYRP